MLKEGKKYTVYAVLVISYVLVFYLVSREDKKRSYFYYPDKICQKAFNTPADKVIKNMKNKTIILDCKLGRAKVL